MKTSTFGILTTVTLTLFPLTAFAQETQVIQQNASNTGIAVGSGNQIRQDVNQNSVQNRFDLNGYSNPSSQISIQGASNSAAAIGKNNQINQGVQQNSVQNNGGDFSQYFKY